MDMTASTDGRTGLRYERKFILHSLDGHDGLRHLRLHPLGFQEIHEERTVVSLYLDTPDYRLTCAHRDNALVRGKWRVRWYEKNGVLSVPQLEWKERRGLTGRKVVYPLNAEATRPPRPSDWLTHDALRTGNWCPVVQITYQRRYFLSRNQSVRATIDHAIRAASPAGPSGPVWNWSLLELKYAAESAPVVTNGPGPGLRPEKHSKFILGMGKLLGMPLEDL